MDVHLYEINNKINVNREVPIDKKALQNHGLVCRLKNKVRRWSQGDASMVSVTPTDLKASSSSPEDEGDDQDDKKDHSVILDLESNEPLNDYGHLIVKKHKIIFRKWNLKCVNVKSRVVPNMRLAEKYHPVEIVKSYHDFAKDEDLHRQIESIFGGPALGRVLKIVIDKLSEKGQLRVRVTPPETRRSF